MALDLPRWGKYLVDLGNALSQIPPVDFGEPAPRVVLSVPTGRFSYWLLASGALEHMPTWDPDCQVGDRVATWDTGRMRDSFLEDAGPDRWRLESGLTVQAGNWPVVAVPENTPADRRAAKVEKNYKLALAALPGRRSDYHRWFASHCLKPVVIVGSGREHIQEQREILLQHASHWFSDETGALLNEDSAMTSNPDRMLFHPYMVLDAGVGTTRPWIRSLRPRMVVVTAWGARQRMHSSLFSRVPHLIITNRRVRSFLEMEDELGTVPTFPELDRIVNNGRPDGVYATAFSEVAQGDVRSHSDDEEDFDI